MLRDVQYVYFMEYYWLMIMNLEALILYGGMYHPTAVALDSGR